MSNDPLTGQGGRRGRQEPRSPEAWLIPRAILAATPVPRPIAPPTLDASVKVPGVAGWVGSPSPSTSGVDPCDTRRWVLCHIEATFVLSMTRPEAQPAQGSGTCRDDTACLVRSMGTVEQFPTGRFLGAVDRLTSCRRGGSACHSCQGCPSAVRHPPPRPA